MKTPIAYPFVRDASFVSGVGPAIGAAFLNTGQDALGDLYGALLGRSATMEGEDYGALDADLGGLTVLTNTNGGGTFHVGNQTPAAAGEHGVLGVLTTVAAAATFNAESGQMSLDVLDFVWSAKVKLTGRARLDLVGNNGFRIGLQNPPDGIAKNFTFIAGNDQANWQYVIAGSGVTNTGVAATDGTWYDLQIARIGQSATAYINGALVGTVAANITLPIARRKIEIKSPGANVSDGLAIDYFRVWYQR
jgi:hypothetical protein